MHKKNAWIIFFLISIPVFSLYAYTSPTTVYWQDAGIYLSGIKTLGIVYPPGYPLYIVGGFLWTKLLTLLFGDALTLAGQVHLLSGVFGAAAAGVVGLTVEELIRTSDIKIQRYKDMGELLRNKKQVTNKLQITNYKFQYFSGIKFPLETHNPQLYSLLNTNISSLISGYAAGFSYALWAQSINAEVYSLQGLFTVVIFYCAIRIIELHKTGNDQLLRHWLGRLVAVWGLAFANHPTAFLFAPAIIGLFWGVGVFRGIRAEKNYGLLFRLIGVLILFGFVPYLYLPIRSAMEPLYLWNKIDSLSAFIKHLSGTAYVSQESSLTLFDSEKLRSFPKIFFEQFWYIGGVLVILGIFRMLFKENKSLRSFALFGIGLGAAIYLIVFFYQRGTEYFFWLVPFYIFCAIALGYAVYLVSEIRLIRQIGLIGLMTLGIVVLSSEFLANYRFLNRRDYTLAEEFGKNILKNLPDNSVLFTIGDQSSTIPQYLQYVEGYRKDIAVVWDFTLMSDWQRQRLSKRYPNIVLPEAPAKPELTGEETGNYINAFIEANLDRHSIFLLSKKAVPVDEKYLLIPAGTLWQVERQEKFLNLAYWDYQFTDPQRYNRPEKAEKGNDTYDAGGNVIGKHFLPYYTEARTFEMQAAKNLGDICLTKAKEGGFLQLIKVDETAEQWTGRRLSVCAKDEYLKLFILDPQFYNAEVYENLSEAYRDLGLTEEANKYHTEVLKRMMD